MLLGVGAGVGVGMGGVLEHDAHAKPLWHFRTFTTADGLAHNIVRDVLETRDGGLWFATLGGITRYEPRRCRYEIFPLPGAAARLEVMDLEESADGTLWAATRGAGVGQLRAGRWTWHTTRQGLPSDEVTALLIDRAGRVWATPAGGGLARLEGARWRTLGPADGLGRGEVARCSQLRSGAIACGTFEAARMLWLEGARWRSVAIDAPTRRPFHVHTVLEARSGELWVATKGAGVLQGRRTPAGYQWRVHDTTSGLAGNRVSALLEDRAGALWVTTSAGVSRWDGRAWQSLNRQDGLASDQLSSVTETRDGALWFGTLGGGASRHAPSRWERIGEAEGLPSESLTGGLLVSRDGSLWAGTNEGLAVLRQGRWSTQRAGELAMDRVSHLLEARDGALWVATRGGVRISRRGVWHQLAGGQGADRGPIHGNVRHLVEDRGGRVWLATAGGVSVTDRGERWRAYTAADGLPSSAVNDLLVDEGGRLWAATDAGAARLEGERWAVLPGPAESRGDRILGLAIDGRGQLWASGLEGISRLENERWAPAPASPWIPPGVYARSVVATPDGSLWFLVRGQGVRRLREGIWTGFSTRDGLSSDTVSDVDVAPDGALLFSTLGGGLSRYRPDRDPPDTQLGAPIRGRAPRAASTVVYGEEAVISFAGQDVLKDTETADLLYSYRVDAGPWSAFARDPRALLGRLPAGAHSFEVRAMDLDMNIDPTPAVHRFRVVRPWWSEPWLLAVVGLTLLFGIYAGLRLMRAVARERAAVARERAAVDRERVAVAKEQGVVGQQRQFVRLASHELRKPLARLAHRAEMLVEPATLERGKLGEYARAIGDDSRQLARLVEQLLDQSRMQAGLQLTLQEGDLRELAAKLTLELAQEPGGAVLTARPAERALPVRHDPFYLTLAVRNLLDNALKYAADAGPIEVVSEARGEQARLLVRDQGPGIPEEERARLFEPFFRGRAPGTTTHSGFGLGLAFARDIARAHGGELTLEPSERGCVFCLALPLVGPGEPGAS